jgi:hypothetical protein
MIVVVNQKHREYHEGTDAAYEPPRSDSDVDPDAARAAEKLRRALALNPVPAAEEAPEEVQDFEPESPASLAFSPLHTSTPPRTPSLPLPFPPFLLHPDEEEEEKMAAAVEEIRASTYVGFDSITRQIEHKLLKRGFQFNVMVVGMWALSGCFEPMLNVGYALFRSNWTRKEYLDQHHFRVSPYRLQGSF